MTSFDINQLDTDLRGIDLRTFVKIPAILELIEEHVNELVVNTLPLEIRNREYSEASSWDVRIVRRSPGMYAVQDQWGQYTKGLVRGREGLPSSRTDRFKNSHRFPLAEAIDIAYKVAAKTTLNGMSASDYILWCEAVDLTEAEAPEGLHLSIRDKYNELKAASQKA